MHLVIVQHFKPEFESETAEFFEYFRNQVRLPLQNIHFYNFEIYKRKIGPEDFLKDVVKINEPIVIYYGGHGYQNGWELSPNCRIYYSDIIQILEQRKKPIIFVNDCCFAMALKDHLSKLQCRYLLLGLAPKTLEGYGSLVPGVTECWKNRRPADPKLWVWKRNELTPFVLDLSGRRLRYGAKLDHFCYPKK